MPRTLDATELVALLGPWRDLRPTRQRALVAALTAAADRGLLPAGTRLPSERSLATALELSRGTVVATYDALVDSGLLERRAGSGTYVVPRDGELPAPPTEISATALIDRWLVHGQDVIDLSMSVIPIPEDLPRVEVPAMALFDSGPGHGYAFDGLPALRRAVAGHLATQGITGGAQDVIVTSGAQQAISLAASCFLRAGDVVAVESPTYPGAVAAFTRAGARLVPIATDAAGVRPEALDDVLRREHPTLVYLVPTCHNPLGSVLSPGRRDACEQILRRAGVPVLEDQTMADLWFDRPPSPPLAAGGAPNIATIGSASKVLWGGLRIGWIRARGAMRARLSAAKSAHDFATSVPSQVLAAELLGSVDDAFLERRRQWLASHLAVLEAEIGRAVPAWTWAHPAGGTALWIDLGGRDGDRFALLAERHGVAVAPGSITGTDGEWRGHIRVAYTLADHLLALAVDRLAAAWTFLTEGEPLAMSRPTP